MEEKQGTAPESEKSPGPSNDGVDAGNTTYRSGGTASAAGSETPSSDRSLVDRVVDVVKDFAKKFEGPPSPPTGPARG
jgi:hypothetical protein